MKSDLPRRPFWLGVGSAALGVAAFLLVQLHAWPPHEDEVLALFIGQKPFGELFHTVLAERGGAPLHFVITHLVADVSATLTAVRLISVVFAVASIPVVALLATRLTDRRTALVATVLAAASWVTLFHGIYGRMYSLFLFTSALSFLALLRALERRNWTSWALWAVAIYAVLASHQYGAFVLGIQVVYVLVLRTRRSFSLLPGGLALLVVVLAAIPLWRSTFVLGSRFDVGVGGGGPRLGGPVAVLEYLRSALGDFVAGWPVVFALIACVALLGLIVLAREHRSAALLTGLVFLLPAVGLALLRVGGGSSAPETRHLIFALPFFVTLVAAGVIRVARLAGTRGRAVLSLLLAALVAAEVAWGWQTTPTLYAGEPTARRLARDAAVAWLAQTSAPNDVLFGYDPLFLGARERGAPIGTTVVPRADAALALTTLQDAGEPLGRGVWVLDASDGARIEGNRLDVDTIEARTPGPEYEARTFGPFLVVRTLAPTETAEEFLLDTERVQRVGLELGVVASSIHIATARLALASLDGEHQS